MKAVFVALVMMGVVGCSKPSTPTQSATTTPTPTAPAIQTATSQPTPKQVVQPKMTRAELKQKLKGMKTGHDVLAAIGKPTKTDQKDAFGNTGPRYYLIYVGLTQDEVSGAYDSNVVIELVGYGLDSSYITYKVNP